MRKNTLLLLAAASMFFTALSCSKSLIEPSGITVTTDRNISDAITTINCYGNITVNLRKGDKNSVSVTSDTNTAQYLVSSENNGVLYLDMAKSQDDFAERPAFTVDITYVNAPETINASSSATINTLSDLDMENRSLKVKLMDQASFNVVYGTIQNCSQLDLTLASYSSANVLGNVSVYNISASGRSTVKGFHMISDYLDINAGSRSSVEAVCMKEFSVKAYEYSSVSIKGEGKPKSMDIQSGSEISFGE